MMLDKVIINSGDFMSCYGFLEDGETELQAIERAKDYYNRDLELCKRNFENYGDKEQNKDGFYTRQYEKAVKKADAKILIMDFEEWEAAKKKELCKDSDMIEVSKEDFEDALNVLPPLAWGTHENVEMFCMSEFYSGTITNQYGRYNGKYYCKLVDYRDKSTWICETLKRKGIK